MSKKDKIAKKNSAKIKPGRLARREAITGLLFVTPWIIGACIFLAYTMGTSFWYALNNIRMTPMGKKFTYVGTGNFTQILLADVDFTPQLIEYITSTVLSVPIIVVFALIIAMLLNGPIKCKGFFRLIFFLPVIVVSGPVMGMLNAQGAATISTIDITVLWYSGVQILIFLSALQKIDSSMYEAAQMDGGSGWECFWKITLPTVKPMILLNVIYTIVFVSGNEQNAIITLIKNAMFSGTKEKGYGYASAMAWLYSMVVVLIVVIFAVVLMARKDIYERQVKKAKKEMKKEAKMVKKIERRGIRNAKKIEKARKKRKYSTYDGSGDY